MSEAVDIYIDTTSHDVGDATEFDFDLFERFVRGGPWVVLSEYLKLKEENARLLDLVRILVNCMGEVDRCDTCPINGNPYDVSVEDWFACDSLRDMLAEAGVLDG